MSNCLQYFYFQFGLLDAYAAKKKYLSRVLPHNLANYNSLIHTLTHNPETIFLNSANCEEVQIYLEKLEYEASFSIKFTEQKAVCSDFLSLIQNYMEKPAFY